MFGLSKGKLLAYGAVYGIAILSPELFFLNTLQLEVYVLGTDYSRIVAYFFGACIGIIGRFIIRKVTGATGAGFIGSLIKGGGVL
jgi:hypothetical protein